MGGLIHLLKDPILFCLVIVAGVVFWKAWVHVMDGFGFEDGIEFRAAGVMFLIALALLAVTAILRFGIKKATGL